MRFFLFSILMCIFLFACQENINPVNSQKTPTIFFDLKDFFKKETIQLAKIKSFKKTVSINGKLEEKKLDNLDFDNEFSIFVTSDINKPAWSDKYKIDSVFAKKNQLTQINYTALDNKLKTKKISIDFQNNAVSNITVEKAVENAVTQSKQHLNYSVGKGYSIQSEQALSLSETKTIKVEVEYLLN